MIKSNRALVLRNCRPDMTSHNGFKWPQKGKVTAPDWSPEPKCGNGLHGLLWGEGFIANFYQSDGAKWFVVSIERGSHVDLGGKVKFQSGYVVYCGNRTGAVKYIQDRCEGKRVVYGTAEAGNGGKATAGNCGTAIAGEEGTAIAGEEGTAEAGNGGIISIHYFDDRKRIKVGYIGEDGLLPNVVYRLNAQHEFEEKA